MEIERALKNKLTLNCPLPRRTTEQKRKDNIVKKIISSIVPFITATEEQPFSIIPDHMHLKIMIRLYKKWKFSTEYNFHNVDEYFESQFLSYLIKICYYWWVEDFEILSTITSFYYKATQRYYKIYDANYDRRNSWDSLFESMRWLDSTKNKIDKTDYSPLLYYLMNYNYGRLTVNGKTFANDSTIMGSTFVPLCSDCFEHENPGGLLLLLQYEGRFSGTEDMGKELKACREMFHDLLRTIQIVEEHITELSKQNIFPKYDSEAWQKKMLCLTLLLRVVPQGAVCTLFDRDTTVYLLSWISQAFNLNSDPEDIANKLFNPRKLQHLCRLRIRRMDVVQAMAIPFLPSGIETLNLPRYLKDYINLLHD